MPEISEVPPTNNYQAADWLIARHPWARENVARVVGRDPLADEDFDWLEALADAWIDAREHDAAWGDYADRNREPSDGDAWEAWREAGPHASPAVHQLGVMSSGEKRMARLVATLHPTKRPEWSVSDLDGLDERGVAVVLDWVLVILHNAAWTPAAKRAYAAVLTA